MTTLSFFFFSKGIKQERMFNSLPLSVFRVNTLFFDRNKYNKLNRELKQQLAEAKAVTPDLLLRSRSVPLCHLVKKSLFLFRNASKNAPTPEQLVNRMKLALILWVKMLMIILRRTKSINLIFT